MRESSSFIRLGNVGDVMYTTQSLTPPKWNPVLIKRCSSDVEVNLFRWQIRGSLRVEARKQTA